MKKLRKYLFMLCVTLLSTGIVKAQDSIPLPSNVIVRIWAELKEKDDLKVELNKKDSIITIYEIKLGAYAHEVHTFRIQAKDYEETVKQLEALVKWNTVKLRDQNKEIYRLKRKGKLKTVALGALVLIALIF